MGVREPIIDWTTDRTPLCERCSARDLEPKDKYVKHEADQKIRTFVDVKG